MRNSWRQSCRFGATGHFSAKDAPHLPASPKYWMFRSGLIPKPEALMSESPVTEVQEPAQHPPRPPLRLVVARSEAAERLKNQLKIGSAIRDQRVRDMWELSHARAEKQE